jgi:hypothetical protein
MQEVIGSTPIFSTLIISHLYKGISGFFYDRTHNLHTSLGLFKGLIRIVKYAAYPGRHISFFYLFYFCTEFL